MESLNKKFGYLVASLFSVFGTFLLFTGRSTYALILYLLAFGTLIIARRAPRTLTALTNSWIQFGILLGKFFNPIILGFLFFIVITPIAVISKFFGRDELLLKRVNQKSYWLTKEKNNNALKNSFESQF